MNASIFHPVAQAIWARMPDLGKRLHAAQIDDTPLTYLSEMVANSAAAALAAMAGSHIAFQFAGDPQPATSLALALITLSSGFLYYLSQPSHLLSKRARGIEESLVFSLHAINIELHGGAGFAKALENVARGDYGHMSAELVRILNDSHRMGLGDAIRESIKRIPSKTYGRAMWQLHSGMETGADIRDAVAAILSDLSASQRRAARSYAGSMERHLTLYVMGGVVLPALAVAIIQTVSSLGLTNNPAGEPVFWSILFASAAVQASFIFLAKFRRPAILGRHELPISQKPSLPLLLSHAGITKTPKRYILEKASVTLIFSAATSYLLSPHMGAHPLLIFATVLPLTVASLYSHLIHLAEKRGSKAAEHLPDALRTMASNIRAGLPVEKAMFAAAREDYPVLGRQVRLMAGDMAKNMTFSQSLINLKERIRNGPLHMSANLISHGASSGRALADCLTHIAEVIGERANLREGAKSQLSAIRATVIILVVGCAPVLYSCSHQAAQMMGRFNDKLAQTLPADIAAQSFIKPQKAAVTTDFLQTYIMVNLFVTALLGAAIVGETSSGRLTDGIRYALAMVLGSQLVYLASKNLISSQLGGLLI